MHTVVVHNNQTALYLAKKSDVEERSVWIHELESKQLDNERIFVRCLRSVIFC